MDKEKALEDLKIIKKVLDKNEVEFFLAYGTCLGAYRNGDFLPDDDDIDLGVVAEISPEKRKKVGWMLYDLGFMPQQIMFNVFGKMEPSEVGYNGDEKTGIIVCEKNVHITIFFFYKEYCEQHKEDEYVCIPKMWAKKLIGSPARFYKKFNKIKFKGLKFNMPSPTKEYLAWTYEDWKNPLMRDHGKLYPELHSKEGMFEDVGSSQRAVSINSPKK